MEWYNILVMILGAIGGTGGIISIYTAKAKKSSIEIDNFKKLFDEAQNERESIKKEYADYTEKMDLKIQELETKLNAMDLLNTAKLRAINSAYRCPLPQNINDCPVLKTLDEESPKEMSCKVPKN